MLLIIGLLLIALSISGFVGVYLHMTEEERTELITAKTIIIIICTFAVLLVSLASVTTKYLM